MRVPDFYSALDFLSEADSTPSAVAEAPSPASRSRLQGARVLLVEDDADLREAMSIRLSHEGCLVTDAATGSAARWSLLSCTFDAVILDLGLPNGSGLDVLDEVRKVKSLPPVMVLTGSEAAERDRARASGATFVLTKPTPFDVVREKLSRLLG
jgi:DNA-binding response OmpR family regulator